MKPYQILPISEAHLPGVAALENACFAFPWTEDGLRTLLGETGSGEVLVTEDGTVAAYAGLVWALDEGEITNVATLPSYRRQGYARAVLEALLRDAGERGLVKLFLEVRESNEAARALYTSLGFSVVGRRPGFYHHPSEAALVMARDLTAGQ